MSKTNDKEWLKKFELAKKYFSEFGNLLIPYDYEVKGIKLGRWIGHQRDNYKNKRISQERIRLLESIGMVWDASIDYDKCWQKNYELAEQYYNEFGNLRIPRNYVIKGVKLGSWTSTQRKDYKKNKLSKEKIKLLEKINMVWIPCNSKWQRNYELAEQYFFKFGNLLIPRNYVINGIKLGIWIYEQRRSYRNNKLSEEKISLLEKINMVWNVLEAQWETNYELAEQYYKEFGDLLIPCTYVTRDNVKLGIWLNNQRQDYKNNKLSKEQIDLLEKLNINWNPLQINIDNWFFMYNLCVEYYNKYGHLYISSKYETEDKIKLGEWICKQRRKYKNTLKGEKRNKQIGVLSQEQIDLLNKIGMIWEPIPIKGCSFFEYVIFYYLKIIYGEDNVSYRDKSLGFELDVYIPSRKIAFEYDGYPWHLEKLEKDKKKNQFCIDNNIILYRFRESNLPNIDNFKNIINIVNVDNAKYEEIFNIIIKELNLIFKNNLNLSKKDVCEEYHNYILKYFDLKWLEKYDLCLDYYEENGNLLIPCEYEINGIKLGRWLCRQKRNYKNNKLSQEKIKMLESIGMVWSVLTKETNEEMF